MPLTPRYNAARKTLNKYSGKRRGALAYPKDSNLTTDKIQITPIKKNIVKYTEI